MLCCFYGDIHTDIFAEGFRDKIFDTKIVNMLGHALSNENHTETSSTVVTIFTAALAQGVAHCFQKILMLTYSQRGFGTSYLILRLSLHLDTC